MRKIYQKKKNSQLFYYFVLGFRLNDNHLGLQFAFTFGLILAFSLVRIPRRLRSLARLSKALYCTLRRSDFLKNIYSSFRERLLNTAGAKKI